jgi:catechol 2,3-dioxygenase-like lactoylglutathione lyase family enzyme
MAPLGKAARSAIAAVFVLAMLQASTPARLSAQAKGAVVGTGAFTSFVENMDRSLAFYHDVFDMEVPPIPASGERPYNPSNPRLYAMFQINGAKERHQSARVPGTRLAIEVMEIQNVEHKTVTLRMQDPGIAAPVFVVRDIDAALARIKQANARVVTPGGSPVLLPDRARAILVRDIDGRPLELLQPSSLPESTAPATNNIVDLRLSITVNDMDRTLHIYRDVLGFTVSNEIANDTTMRALTGLSKADVRRARVQATGSPLAIELLEFKGVAKTPLHTHIQDRGAARLQLRAQNLDALVDAMKAAGMTVVSEGGVAVPIPPNLRGALVADPNNFFLTPFEPCDGCASFGRANQQSTER